MHTMVPSSVWQRRTNKIIAAAVIIIGLTMMISTIPQCIYIGLIFIIFSLGWLGWIRMKEKKIEPPQQPSISNHTHTTSPVLFLVASQHIPTRPSGPTLADPNDKPPSYDQVLKLDELPPDYFTVLSAKPPRYEDVEAMCSNVGKMGWPGAIALDLSNITGLARVHSCGRSSSNSSGSSSGSNGSLAALTPLTLEVPNLSHDVGYLSPPSWSIHTEDLPHSDIDIRLEECAAWVVQLPYSKSSEDLKKNSASGYSESRNMDESGDKN